LSGFLGFEFDFQRVAQGSKALGDWSGHNSDIDFFCFFREILPGISGICPDQALYY
jgi:hypothetical protein